MGRMIQGAICAKISIFPKFFGFLSDEGFALVQYFCEEKKNRILVGFTTTATLQKEVYLRPDEQEHRL